MRTSLDSRALTAELGRARTLLELLSLHQRHGNRFSRFNIAAFWSKFKKLPRGELGGIHNRLALVCEQTARMLPRVDARQVSDVAHAFAKSRLVGSGPYQGVWAVLEEVSRRRLGDLDAQGLSMTSWAFATAAHASPQLFDAISAEVARRGLHGFNEQHLSNTVWAFAKAGHEAPALLEAISVEAVRRGLGNFDEHLLSITAWAFATADHEAPELFEAISAESMRRGLSDFHEQNLSNTAWAFATVGHATPELYDAISAEVVRRGFGGFNEQQLSNTAWSFAVSNPSSADKLFGTSSFTTQCAHLETSFSRSALRQLHQWSLWRDERRAPWPGLHESLLLACRVAFTSHEVCPSQLQSDVVRKIRSRGFNVEEEHRCEASGYSIDALVTLKDDSKIAVEVDGPSHLSASRISRLAPRCSSGASCATLDGVSRACPTGSGIPKRSCTGCESPLEPMGSLVAAAMRMCMQSAP